MFWTVVGQYVVPCSRQPSQQTMPLSLMPGGVTENTTSLECIQCKRSVYLPLHHLFLFLHRSHGSVSQIASPRYAQHLSECMGLTGRKRRPALSRTLASGNRASPYLTGDSDEDDEDSAVAIKKRSAF